MKCSSEFESERRRRKVLNTVELGDVEQVYIRLDDGKKYLLNGDGCWRCGSTARCFGNMDGNELEVVCEFDLFDEVRCLFLVLLQNRVNRSLSWLRDKTSDKSCGLVDGLADIVSVVINCANLKKT